MNPHNNFARTAHVPTFRRLRAAAGSALPALVALLTVLSLAIPSLAQAVPASPPALPVLYVDKDAAEGGDGTSWETAYRYLHDALEHATGGQIWVAEGVYYPDEGDGQTDGERTQSFRLVKGVAVYGGFDGTETSVGERDWLSNVTVLSGDLNQNNTTDGNGVVTDPANIVGIGEEDYDNSYHVVTASDVSLSAELNGFVITAGVADGDELENHDKGAGIYNDASGLTLINALLSGNASSSTGARIYNTGSGPLLINVTVAGNRAGTTAGGMFNTADSHPGLHNSIFWDNRDATGTGTASATIHNDDVDSEPDINYSLVQALSSIDHIGSNNLALKPWFTVPLDPILAPSTAGDFTLGIFSPAIDIGDNASNPTVLETDLAGGPRLVNEIIDLGPYEAPYVPIYDIYLPIVLRAYTP